jgi:hypothetical protein
MVLHRLSVLVLLAWGLGLTSQASANTLLGVRFVQHGTLSRVMFDLQQAVSYRIKAGSAPSTLRIVFTYKPTLPPAEIGHPDLLYPVTVSYIQLGLFDEAQHLLQTVLTAAATPLQRTQMALVQSMLFAQNSHSDVVTALLTSLQQFADPTRRGQALLLTENAWRAQRMDKVIMSSARAGH